MMRRCGEPGHKDFADYGARGIKVCGRWHDLALFAADMGPKPTPRHTIDRIDNDKGYEPGNCRWATWREQRMNQRPRPKMTLDERRAKGAARSRKWYAKKKLLACGHTSPGEVCSDCKW